MNAPIEIHQLLAGAAPGDAVTSMAQAMREALSGFASSAIYALHIDPAIDDDEILPVSRFPLTPSRHRIIIYHSSIGDPVLTHFISSRAEPIVLVYHNMTPSEFFVDVDPWVATLLAWGRLELKQIRDQVVLAVADSDFNAIDLVAAGYETVHVLPVGVNANRLVARLPHPEVETLLDSRHPHPYVVAVGQLFPHKRHELLIEAVHVLRHIHRLDVGLVIVGVERQPAYTRALRLLVEDLDLDEVTMTGRVSDRALASYLRRASLYMSASEHEGLAVPPLEAMTFGRPVVVRGFGALPVTVGSGGLVLDPTSGPLELAEAAAMVLGDEELYSELQRAGARRVLEFDPAHTMAQFIDLLASVI